MSDQDTVRRSRRELLVGFSVFCVIILVPACSKKEDKAKEEEFARLEEEFVHLMKQAMNSASKHAVKVHIIIIEELEAISALIASVTPPEKAAIEAKLRELKTTATTIAINSRVHDKDFYDHQEWDRLRSIAHELFNLANFVPPEEVWQKRKKYEYNAMYGRTRIAIGLKGIAEDLYRSIDDMKKKSPMSTVLNPLIISSNERSQENEEKLNAIGQLNLDVILTDFASKKQAVLALLNANILRHKAKVQDIESARNGRN